MDPRAVEKATLRLEKARASLQRVEASKNFKEFLPAWMDLLTDLHGIYTPLEQGAKVSPQSRQWYGQKKEECRKDALLLYLNQARNADEHGIEPIAKHEPGHLSVGAPGESVHARKLIIRDGTMIGDFINVDGKPPTVTQVPARAVLVTVKDTRFNTTFDPPTSHLGTRVDDGSPMNVARLALTYYAQLVSDAGSLVK